MANIPRSTVTSKTELLRTISQMYYILEMNQQEIAQKLNIGRSSVARFLSEARDAGIVEIRVKGNNDQARDPDLEAELRTQYKLRDAVVISSASLQDYYSLSASYLSSILPYDGIIAVGGGSTLYSIMQLIRTTAAHDKLVCIQSTGIMNEGVPSTAVVQLCAENLSATAKYISLPGIVMDPVMRNQLMQNSMFETDYQSLKQADISICGIGHIDQMEARNYENPVLAPYWDEIRKNCVGDIYFHLYNQNGEFCMPSLSASVCGLSTTDLLKIPVRIGAAIGEEKVAAIKGALTGRLINILLTDSRTAAKLV